MKIFILLVLLLAVSQLKTQSQTITPLYPTENQILLSGIWKFKYIPALTAGNDSLFYTGNFDISKWDDIKVPGHWELQGFAEPTYKSVKEGTGLYRTTFNLPSSFKNNPVFIRFEGVLYAYDVYVNGKKAGQWNSSFNAASFNISNLVRFDRENILAVKVSTRSKCYLFDINDDWALSGIFRDVVLFGTPDIYIDDYTVQTLLDNNHPARVKINVKLQNIKNGSLENCSVKMILKSPDGKPIQEKLLKAQPENNAELLVDSPELWTAETPLLYSLEISLFNKEEELQKLDQKIGIREVSIDGAVLKLNGKPVKLRGVDYHDLNPQTGKTFTRQQILKDLLLMKKANINFIRTSHYPPDRRRLDLCDSLGIYVDCEVPFGFGSGNLKDSTFQDILLRRAKATLLRDKNHPSIIFWSLGNENPVTPITNVTARYVKKTDPTRPVCYPQMGSYFNENYQIIPDYIDIYAPHYRNAEWVRHFAKETDRPVIQTEYAHGLGLSFGNMAEIWQEMFSNKSFAGGAVWVFQDQGILRKAEKPVDTTTLTYDVWIDSLHYYNTTLDGADGIVYPDRTPQADYWQLRKVYSPVQIIETKLPVKAGQQDLKFTAYNQYDFTNLNTLPGTWKLYKNRDVTMQGEINLDCAPHDTVSFSLPVKLPENPEKNVWFLQFEYKDKTGIQVYEHSAELTTSSGNEGIGLSIRNSLDGENREVKNEGNEITIETNDFIYNIKKNNLRINLITSKSKKPILSTEIYAKTGHAPKMADVTVRDKYTPDTGDYFWAPWLLKPEVVTTFCRNTEKNETQIYAKEIFFRGEKFPGQKLNGEFQYSAKNTGALKIAYKLVPVNASGVFLEAGISFILPPEISDFRWLGNGPYASYPDKNRLNDFGIHQMHKNDINFNGNRSNVKIAVLTNDEGNGIAILGNPENISVELNNHRIVVSHNVLLSGVGNKKSMPEKIVWAKDVPEIKGELEIIPLRKKHWPEILKKLFGEPGNSPVPFNPFYYSYDTTK